MSSVARRPAYLAAAAVVLTVLALLAHTAPLLAQSAQSGKPEYDPEVEAVARSIFFELMSPY
jgi:hypothetical protein